MADALTRRWFERPAPIVARDLLGRTLVRTLASGERRRVRIVETEAYEADDPASHSFRGFTTRSATMFGPAGHLYVYLIYGMHHCLNVVTGPRGHGAAVLVRAAEPLEGAEGFARARGTDDPRAWCSGPARLAQALELDLAADGLDLLHDAGLRLVPGTPVAPERIERGPRIGISRGTGRRWRFAERGTPWRSGPPVSRRRQASRR